MGKEPLFPHVPKSKGEGIVYATGRELGSTEQVMVVDMVQLLYDLQKSMAEEKEAIEVYRQRANYARNFPELANLYRHIGDEEAHHLQELTNAVDKLRRK